MATKQGNTVRQKLLRTINRKMSAPIHNNSEGILTPLVCIVCDRFVLRKDIRYINHRMLEDNVSILEPQRDLSASITRCYTYNGKGTNENVKRCLLSKKGTFDEDREEFIGCFRCYKHLEKNEMPTYAIANKFEIGELPTELAILTDVELAFISNIKCHTHLLTFFGGHQGIKGWHSLIKTNLVTKRRALESIDSLEMVPNKVIVILGGQLTNEQHIQILSKTTIWR